MLFVVCAFSPRLVSKGEALDNSELKSTVFGNGATVVSGFTPGSVDLICYLRLKILKD